MRRHILILAGLAALAVVAHSMANNLTATLTLSGTVSRSVSITVTPQNNYSSLDISAGESDKLVGIVNEYSNVKEGYRVSLTSAGASGSQPILKAATPGNKDVIPYTLKNGGTPVVLNNGVALLTSASGRTAVSGTNNLLTVTIPAATVSADSYSDTLTFTIQGN